MDVDLEENVFSPTYEYQREEYPTPTDTNSVSTPSACSCSDDSCAGISETFFVDSENRNSLMMDMAEKLRSAGSIKKKNSERNAVLYDNKKDLPNGFNGIVSQDVGGEDQTDRVPVDKNKYILPNTNSSLLMRSKNFRSTKKVARSRSDVGRKGDPDANWSPNGRRKFRKPVIVTNQSLRMLLHREQLQNILVEDASPDNYQEDQNVSGESNNQRYTCLLV